MAVSPARVAAYEILLRIDREKSYATELLHSGQYEKLSPADHGLATELVMGVQRWLSVLDDLIAAESSQKLAKLDAEVLTALRLGAYQLMFLDRVPQHAAVNESVDLVKRARKRSAVPFANAILRKLAKQPREASSIGAASGVEELARMSAHPTWLVERWTKAYGIEVARAICEADQRHPEMAIRISEAGVEGQLSDAGIRLAPGKVLASARRVVSGDITHTPQYRSGQIAIQDEASQLVALLAGKASSLLDCCAAPGGKTRVLAQQNPQSTVVAAELYPQRARLLARLVKDKNVRVMAADACALPFASGFERVLADVPCSGTGTLAHNPEIKWRLRLEDLADLQTRQIAILRSAMAQAAPRGRVIYSTCSLEPEENEEVVEQALAGNAAFRVVDCREELERLRKDGELVGDPNAMLRGKYLRTIPGANPGEGFFAAILERVDG